MSARQISGTLAALHRLSKHLKYQTTLRDRQRVFRGDARAYGPSKCPIEAGMPEACSDSDQRVLEHCLVYSQVYAAIEDFVSRRLATTLSTMSKRLPPSQYPPKLTRTFRENCAMILRDIDKQRYASIDPKEIVSTLGDMLSDTKREINSQVALLTFENHRLGEISRLLELCGIEGLKARIEADERFVSFFKTASAEDNTVESYLARIVRERNAVAHSVVEYITSAALQLETIQFAGFLARCLDDYVYQRELEIEHQVGCLVEIGFVSETFRTGRIAIVKFTGEITSGDRMLIRRGDRNFLLQVTSLQLEGEGHAVIKSLDEIEIGVMGAKFQIGDKLLRSLT
jgi:hypothetical protein